MPRNYKLSLLNSQGRQEPLWSQQSWTRQQRGTTSEVDYSTATLAWQGRKRFPRIQQLFHFSLFFFPSFVQLKWDLFGKKHQEGAAVRERDVAEVEWGPNADEGPAFLKFSVQKQLPFFFCFFSRGWHPSLAFVTKLFFLFTDHSGDWTFPKF